MFIHKKIIFSIIIVLLLVGGVFAVWWHAQQDLRIQSTQFTGKIDKIEENRIYITGGFIFTGASAGDVSLNEKLMAFKSVQVEVSSKTQIIGTFYTRPSMEQLKIKKGPYNMNDLEHKEQVLQLEDLVVGTPITVTGKGNIYGKEKFTATRIDFTDVVSAPAATQ